MSDTLPPRYETLELVVPEPPRRIVRANTASLVLQAVAAFLLGALIGYTIGKVYDAAANEPGAMRSAAAREDNGSYPTIGPRSPGQGSAQSQGSVRAMGAETAGSFAADAERWSGDHAGLITRRAGFDSRPATSLLAGLATWYDVAPGNAAAGPALRAWLGSGWRGTAVKVCHDGCVLTVLTDWCACADRSGRPTLIDLSRSDFAVIAPISSGVTTVTVSRAGAIALPATDTE